jgi:hypothetical protein
MDAKIKYPRTSHLPWSEGMTDDDVRNQSVDQFFGMGVVVTEKMDGENTTLYRNTMHARSLDSNNHPSRDWVKRFWSEIRWNIPEGWRVCGENLFARHSIEYTDLESYFMGFSIWDERNVCLSWADTLEWFDVIGVTPVRVLFEGAFDEKVIKNLSKTMDLNKSEGYVVRNASEFHYNVFASNVAKYVRKNHVQSEKHWTQELNIVRNG